MSTHSLQVNIPATVYLNLDNVTTIPKTAPISSNFHIIGPYVAFATFCNLTTDYVAACSMSSHAAPAGANCVTSIFPSMTSQVSSLYRNFAMNDYAHEGGWDLSYSLLPAFILRGLRRCVCCAVLCCALYRGRAGRWPRCGADACVVCRGAGMWMGWVCHAEWVLDTVRHALGILLTAFAWLRWFGGLAMWEECGTVLTVDGLAGTWEG